MEFQYFLPESEKVRENDLAEVTLSLSLISRHIFVTQLQLTLHIKTLV